MGGADRQRGVLTPVTTRVLGLSPVGTVTSANAVMQVLFVFAGLGLAAVVVIMVISTLAWCTTGLWGSFLQYGRRPARAAAGGAVGRLVGTDHGLPRAAAPREPALPNAYLARSE